ncbi:hypothetical protein J2X66_001971 [Pseudomonas sp. 3296]|nr:hypothetical protein [Pseudomonas sp. 3296]
MDWERVNVWTNTLYTLIHSLHMAKEVAFGDLSTIDGRARDSADWVSPDCSYASTLLAHQSHGKTLTFRRDPNTHFKQISEQVIKMLIQDLVVILDAMMDEALIGHEETAGNFPQSKVQKLATHLDPRYQWSAYGCYELIAARNVLCHAGGKWNDRSIAIVAPFVSPPPSEGDDLTVGYTMLFNYRKAMRTFLNQVSPAKKVT